MFGISAFSQAPFSSLGEASVVIALTGVSAAGSVGTVAETNNPTEQGNQATGSVGTVVPSRTVAINGVQAAGNVGTVGLGPRSLALSGVQANGTTGTVTAVYWILVNTSQTPNWELVETD